MSAAIPTTLLQRETFELSREMEFFSEKDLTAQIGFPRPNWPVALLKELIDNALDACESANIAPVINLDLQYDALTVEDNGPGLPLSALDRSLDYLVRVSDKNGYVSPSRGQQGNALKTLWAAPFVATGTGLIEVQTAAYRRELRITLDRIAQVPRMELTDPGDPPDVKTGTKITLHWSGIASLLDRYYFPTFYSTAIAVAAFNPHCCIIVNERRNGDPRCMIATDPDWQHWRPGWPTAPHWYTPESFRDLIARFLNVEQRGGKARSVNEFIREFHGLTGTGKAKAVAAAAGLTGSMLRDLIQAGDVEMSKVTALLEAMQQAGRPVKPDALGVLGVAHFTAALVRYGAAPDSVEYRRATGDVAGLPYVLEVGFAVNADSYKSRTLRIGVNFSPALAQPFTALDNAMSAALCAPDDPVVALVHLACPAVQFTDRGKTKAILPKPVADDLQRLVKLVTARFTKAKRQADRDGTIAARALEELANAHKVKPMTTKAAAYQVMEAAYLKASSNGKLPANARQIMYAARPLIIALTGKASPWKKSSTFTQTLLNDFISEHPELCATWDVVFDDRGHFEEPHTKTKIGIGTLAVRRYIRQWKTELTANIGASQFSAQISTAGPANRYRFALFIEKEGFSELLERAQIAARFDLALMSTKGMSTTAARQLVERLSDAGVTILVMRDFDKAGFSIVHTLRTDTRRYQFKNRPDVIDIGLRLADAQALHLDSEPVAYREAKDPRLGLADRGATQDEIDFLVTEQKTGSNATDDDDDDDDDDDAPVSKKARWIGKRVELNAMDSATFIRWLEEKLKEHGVKKVIPDNATIRKAWKRQWETAWLNREVEKIHARMPTAPPPPRRMVDRLSADLVEVPMAAWDSALATRAAKAKRRSKPQIKQHWRFKRLIHPRRRSGCAA